jgi:hypothetical protein
VHSALQDLGAFRINKRTAHQCVQNIFMISATTGSSQGWFRGINVGYFVFSIMKLANQLSSIK